MKKTAGRQNCRNVFFIFEDFMIFVAQKNNTLRTCLGKESHFAPF